MTGHGPKRILLQSTESLTFDLFVNFFDHGLSGFVVDVDDHWLNSIVPQNGEDLEKDNEDKQNIY